MKNLLITLCFLASSFLVSAQLDTIFKVNGTIIPCKIKEVGDDQVKYILPNKSSEISFSTDNNAIRKIVLANGEVMFVTSAMNDTGNYAHQKKNAIKLNFISPVLGFLELGYEYSIKPGRSAEAMISFVNPIFGNSGDAKGVNFRAGMKFLKDPDFYQRGMRYSHILKGAYVRTDILMSFLTHNQSRNFDGSFSSPENKSTSFGFNINLGKQLIYNDAFLIDYFIGVGYGFITSSEGEQSNSDENRRYGWMQGGSDLPLNINAGIRVGFLF